MPAASGIPSFPHFQPTSYKSICVFRGVPTTPLRFNNSIEQLIEHRKTPYLWLQFYHKGYKLGPAKWRDRGLEGFQIQSSALFPWNQWVAPFHRHDWLSHWCWLNSISNSPLPLLPFPGDLPVLKPQHSNHVVDLSGDRPPSWAISQQKLRCDLRGSWITRQYCWAIPRIHEISLSWPQRQRAVTFIIQQENGYYSA